MFYWHHPEALALAVEAWSRHTEPEVKASGVGGATLNQNGGFP
jgi:hypothetical protein